MKFFIALALLGAVFADDAVEPVMVVDVPISAHNLIDYGIAFIPESVLREHGLERSSDDREPVHFVNANGDIQSFVDETPVEEGYAGDIEPVQIVDLPVEGLEAPVEAPIVVDVSPVEEGYAGDIEPVQIVDLPLQMQEGDAPVDAPIFVEEYIGNESPVEPVQIVDNVNFDQDSFKVQVVDLPLEEMPQETEPMYRGKFFPSPLLR